jgi:Kef-type K+ transport system membrane component KefB
MDGDATSLHAPGPVPRRAWVAVGYALMVAGAVVAFLLIRARGEGLAAPARETPPASRAAVAHAPDTFFHVLLVLATVIVAGHALGRLFRLLRQPPVLGEVLAGILLGPSLLGRLAPDVYAYLLPAAVAPYLGVLSQLGVVLYLFLVGLELNPAALRAHGPSVVAISHAGIVVPFLLGAALALGLYPRLASGDVPFTSFALFIGVALAVTAFPVLARILADRGLSKTDLGTMALACAAAGDVTAWCLLALVVGVVQARVSGAVLVMALTAGYIVLMFVAVRPLAVRFAASWEGKPPGRGALAVVCVALLLSALATELIGVHALFGAFLLGAVLPHDSALARECMRQIEDLVVVLLLPAFFAFTGMRTEIGLVAGVGPWLLCGLIVVVATAGKFGGTLAAARLVGLGWRPATALGALMNTRGLMELIVLNVGYDLGVISPTLFAMLVLMALATTLATGPALELLLPPSGAPRPGGVRP